LDFCREVLVFEVGGANKFEHGNAEKKFVLGSTAVIKFNPENFVEDPIAVSSLTEGLVTSRSALPVFRFRNRPFAALNRFDYLLSADAKP
jgi:hypothetical protein